MSKPDFGYKTEKAVLAGQEVTLQCKYVAPGLTLMDLYKVFKEARDNPSNSPLHGNPARWPDVAGTAAVVGAVMKALYDEDTIPSSD